MVDGHDGDMGWMQDSSSVEGSGWMGTDWDS